MIKGVYLFTLSKNRYFSFIAWKDFHFQYGNFLFSRLYYVLKKKKKTPVINVTFHIFSCIEKIAVVLYVSTCSIIYTVDSK